MSLRQEIIPYQDGNGLVCPNRTQPGTLKGSDNGPMFTGEYFVLLLRNGEGIGWADDLKFTQLIYNCLNKGVLSRVPYPQQDGQEGPDDYYGVLNACKQLGITDIPRAMLKAVWRCKGALNNVNPGVFTWQSFLIRQPQLIAAMVSAAFPKKNVIHTLIRLMFLPIYVATASIILTSCMFTPSDQADPRRLSWHLVNTTKGVSILCWLASKVWYWRLYKTYPTGMLGVAALYYRDNHPFTRYKWD